MSHFVTLVLVNTHCSRNKSLKDLPKSQSDLESIREKVEELLTPYDENMEVEEYDRDCGCGDWRAYRESSDHADSVFGTINTIRDRFAENRPQNETPEQRQQEWEKVAAPWTKIKDEFYQKADKSPDTDCGDCGGTGKYKSTYNPKSKWDWWVLGGRWTGYFEGKDFKPEDNPNNLETCFLCRGTGMRNDELGKSIRADKPEYTCNGCGGTGRRLKHPPQWEKVPTDMMPVSSILKMDNPIIPYAVVTPDGEWHQKGDMGWFGISSNEDNKWAEKFWEILKAHPNSLAVVCDLHI